MSSKLTTQAVIDTVKEAQANGEETVDVNSGRGCPIARTLQRLHPKSRPLVTYQYYSLGSGKTYRLPKQLAQVIEQLGTEFATSRFSLFGCDAPVPVATIIERLEAIKYQRKELTPA